MLEVIYIYICVVAIERIFAFNSLIHMQYFQHMPDNTILYTVLFATAGLDYNAIFGAMFILNGSMMTVQISVPIVDDDIFEENESFRGLLTLISRERVTINVDTADVIILTSKLLHN